MPPPPDPLTSIRQISLSLLDIRGKGELGQYISRAVLAFGMYDLQLISGKLERDLRIVPVSYRNRVRPYMQEWIFGRYHAVLSMNRSGKFISCNDPITSPDIYRSFCLMLPDGCTVPGDGYDPYPPSQAAWYHCFMYLMAAFLPCTCLMNPATRWVCHFREVRLSGDSETSIIVLSGIRKKRYSTQFVTSVRHYPSQNDKKIGF